MDKSKQLNFVNEKLIRSFCFSHINPNTFATIEHGNQIFDYLNSTEISED